MKFTQSFTKEDSDRKWYLVDLQDKVLGRAATEIAKVLRGKNKPTFTPHDDVGDFVVVINARGVKLTGNKWIDKKYYHHSGFIGGIKEFSAMALHKRSPEVMIMRAVKGMLPKTHLGKKLLRKLKIYADGAHPHEAQKPQVMALK